MCSFSERKSWNTYDSRNRNAEEDDSEAAKNWSENENTTLIRFVVAGVESIEVVLDVDGRHDDEDDEGEETEDELDDAQPTHEVDTPRHQPTTVHRECRSKFELKRINQNIMQCSVYVISKNVN